MGNLRNIADVVNSGLCLGCGVCTVDALSANPVKMRFDSARGHDVPASELYESQNGFLACPAKGYPIHTLAREQGNSGRFRAELGYYDEVTLVQNATRAYVEKASSSGVMSLLLDYLLERGHVDDVVVTKFVYTAEGPRAVPVVTSDRSEIIAAQGSKYCPVDLEQILRELWNRPPGRRTAFVGTPCQIAGLRYIQRNVRDLGIVYFIGNFCGGIKDYRNVERLISLCRFEPADVIDFRFRGGGQPGSMRVATRTSARELAYPEYVKMTGYNKLLRCHFCVDATGELADFSCGDAWLDRNFDQPTSIVVTRNPAATRMMAEMARDGRIRSECISEDEVVQSQLGNIESKKYRQDARMEWHRRLGYRLPEITEGTCNGHDTARGLEARVWLSHRVKYLAERAGVFRLIFYKSSFLHRVFLKIFGDLYG